MALVYIIEDDGSIREIETYALQTVGLEVQGFELAAPFYEALDNILPDLILLDIMLPDEDGIQVLKRLRSDPRTVGIPVIMVTAKATEIDIVRGLDTGADDYITKPFGIMELISRVRAALRRGGQAQAQPAGILRIRELALQPDKRRCTAQGAQVPLTYKEFELLEYLMVNAGIVLKREQLLDQIWGIDFEGETRTLDTHIKTLRQKLGSCGSYIQTVRNVGYMLQ